MSTMVTILLIRQEATFLMTKTAITMRSSSAM